MEHFQTMLIQCTFIEPGDKDRILLELGDILQQAAGYIAVKRGLTGQYNERLRVIQEEVAR